MNFPNFWLSVLFYPIFYAKIPNLSALSFSLVNLVDHVNTIFSAIQLSDQAVVQSILYLGIDSL